MIEILKNESEIIIGNHCVINGNIRLRDDKTKILIKYKTKILIKDKTTILNGQITLHEKGMISIGEDCMLSGNILMDVSDMHSILDATTMERINPPKDIIIGDHVWIAQGVHILKGATIGRNSVIGAKAIVTGNIPEGSVAVSIPAKVVRTGVTWDRKRL